MHCLRSVVLQPYRPESLTTIAVHFHTRFHFILFFLHCIRAAQWRPLAADNQRIEFFSHWRRIDIIISVWDQPFLPLLPPAPSQCHPSSSPAHSLSPSNPPLLVSHHPPPPQAHLFYRSPFLTLLRVPPAVVECAHLRRMWAGWVGGVGG